jgi:CubicO group peptidase (beta-lactamase class C family)
MNSLPRSTPEAQGIGGAALSRFVDALDASPQEIQTMMLLRHGHVVLEAEWAPYRLSDPHMLFSVSKSFTSMAVGLAIDDGLLGLDDLVTGFFDADELPAEIGANLAALRIRDLLTMTTGHAEDTIERLTRDKRMVRLFLALDVEFEPGTHFAYNSGATYLLSAILQRLTGRRLLDYLRPRLFGPLGATEAQWDVSREGIDAGGWGLRLSTPSVARFGQLLLQKGEWEGKQLVPAEWIEAATAKQVSNANQDNTDWQQGYGFQFWRCRHGAYRGDGAFGQYCVVFPEQDAVLVITSASPNMQEVLDLVWEHLLPAFDGGPGEYAPTAAFVIPPPTGEAPAAGDGREYRFEPNDLGLVSARLDPDGSGSFVIEGEGVRQALHCRAGDWQESRCEIAYLGSRVMTSAHADGDAFFATIRFPQTPHSYTLTCRVTGDELVTDVRVNVGFGPSELTLTGRAH